jgi:hypothetical protein
MLVLLFGLGFLGRFFVPQVFTSHLLVKFHGRRSLSLRLATSRLEKAADAAL